MAMKCDPGTIKPIPGLCNNPKKTAPHVSIPGTCSSSKEASLQNISGSQMPPPKKA